MGGAASHDANQQQGSGGEGVLLVPGNGAPEQEISPANSSTRGESNSASEKLGRNREKCVKEQFENSSWHAKVKKDVTPKAALSKEEAKAFLLENLGMKVSDELLNSAFSVRGALTGESVTNGIVAAHKAEPLCEIYALATVTEITWKRFYLTGDVSIPQSTGQRRSVIGFRGSNASNSHSASLSNLMAIQLQREASDGIQDCPPGLRSLQTDVPPMPETLESFMDCIFADDNMVTLPFRRGTHALDRPLSEYYIRSVGNDFMNCQTAQEVFDSFVTRMRHGGRALYLDIWDPVEASSDFLVFQGAVPSLTEAERNKLTLDVVLNLILKESCHAEFQGSDGKKIVLPTFLSLMVMSRDVDTRARVAPALQKVFGDRIAPLKLPKDHAARLPSVLELANKIIIMDWTSDPNVPEPKEDLQSMLSFTAADSNELFDMIENRNVVLEPGAVCHMSALDVCAYTGVLDLVSSDRLVQVRFDLAANEESDEPQITTLVAADGFNPLRAWRYGVQFVPLDETCETEMAWMQHMLFLRNANCGFVLKSKEFPCAEMGLFSLHVTVITVRNVPRLSSETSPYLKLSMDSGTGSQQVAISTAQPDDTGLFCTWKETFTFKVSFVCEVQTLLITMRDRDSPNNDDLAWAAVHVAHIWPGTRTLQLYNPDCSTVQRGNVLVNFQFTPYIE